jgi:2-hydroxychromene-2-carboxylate isomerase
MSRFARRYGVPLVMNPAFPINTLTLMRGDVGLELREPRASSPTATPMFRAIWVASRT